MAIPAEGRPARGRPQLPPREAKPPCVTGRQLSLWSLVGLAQRACLGSHMHRGSPAHCPAAQGPEPRVHTALASTQVCPSAVHHCNQTLQQVEATTLKMRTVDLTHFPGSSPRWQGRPGLASVRAVPAMAEQRQSEDHVASQGAGHTALTTTLSLSQELPPRANPPPRGLKTAHQAHSCTAPTSAPHLETLGLQRSGPNPVQRPALGSPLSGNFGSGSRS